MIILDGETLAQRLLLNLQDKVDLLKKNGITPCLALIHTSQNEHSIKSAYNKKTKAEKTGIKLKLFHLKNTTQKELVKLIHRLNEDQSIHGIFVQMPLRDKLNKNEIVSAIAPEKDVDGLSPTSIGKILLGEKTFIPAGVEAIFKLLEYYRIKPEGKHWVILGSSNYLCKPLALVLMNKHISLTFCPGFSPDVLAHVKGADVLCVEVFRKHIIGSDM
ncbi:MAG: tetrahydrofolate dehydrogenase/cyclohydrolase catalytic domain-containing protein, partial [Candidatus Hodarchaeales archaeon]